MKNGRRNPNDVRIVITGMGTINPLGAAVPEYWDNLTKGKSGIRSIRNITVGDYPVRIAGEVDLPDVGQYFKERKMARRLDRYVVLAQIAGTQAVRDSGIDIEKSPDRYGSVIGTGDGGVEHHYSNIKRIVQDGMQSASPFFIMSIPNTGAGYLAMEHNLQGPSFSVNSACATANHALGVAATLIRMGMADAIFTGGAEAAIFPSGVAAFGNIGALSERDDSPETASRPFDKDRDGFVLAEGAGVLCLEELEHAKKRGAKIYAELTGFGFSADAYDLVTPHPEARGSAKAIEDALEAAHITTAQVDLINCHATSTVVGDVAECTAINRVFKELGPRVKCHSTKSMTGHSLAAASALEAIACILAITKGVIHPTINQFEQDPAINLNVVKNKPMEAKVDHVLSNGFGFAGQNAAIVLSKFKG